MCDSSDMISQLLRSEWSLGGHASATVLHLIALTHGAVGFFPTYTISRLPFAGGRQRIGRHHAANKHNQEVMIPVSGHASATVLHLIALTHGAVVCLRPVHKTQHDAQCPFDCRIQAWLNKEN